MPVSLPNDLVYPEEYYVKFQQRQRDGENYIIGFMTRYNEHDPKFKDRKDTVESWSKGYGQPEMLQKQALVTKNEPLEGFELLHYVTRSTTDNKLWRLRDPRGFELEISTANFDFLLDYCDVVDRKFQGELVWLTRLNGGRNWLVPADHEEIATIKRHSERRREARQTRISLRDVNRGDIVLLHDGRKVRYFGGMYHVHRPRYGSSSRERRYFFEVLEGEAHTAHSAINGTGLDTKSSLNVGKVIEEDPMTKEEAEAEVNRLLNDDSVTKPYELRGTTKAFATKGRMKKAANAPA